MASPIKFRDLTSLEGWLREQSYEASVVIAMRAAMRVLPLAFRFFGVAESRTELVTRKRAALDTYRAAFLTWVASAYPRAIPRELISENAAVVFRAMDANVASTPAVRHVLAAVANAAATVAADARARGPLNESFADLGAPHFAAVAISEAIEAAGIFKDREVFWESISLDAGLLAEMQEEGLVQQPLWLIDVRRDPQFQANFPRWAREPFDAFDKSNLGSGPWGLWVAWYRAILPNSHDLQPRSTFGEEADIAIAMQPAEFWDGDPDNVMVDVAHLASGAPVPGSERRPEQLASVDVPSSREEVPTTSRRKPKAGAAPRSKRARQKVSPVVGPADAPAPGSLPENVETHSDEPTSHDQLGRRPFAKALVERMDKVRGQGGRDGFAIHLHAPWGAGKTSILMMMSEFLSDKERTAPERWAVVNFNAWQHERRNPPWWPLMEGMKAGCAASLWRNQRRFRALRLHARWLWWKVLADWFPVFLALVGLALVVYLLWFAGDGGATPAATAAPQPKSPVTQLFEIIGGNAVKGLATIATVFVTFIAAGRAIVFGSSNSAKFYFDLSGDPLKRITRLFEQIVARTGMPICIFIDDLDRCRSDYVVDLLEGIQTSFRNPNVTYVIAADRAWIRASFEARYGGFSGTVGDLGQPLGYLFLEKIFQVSTPVPGMGDSIRKAYWNTLLMGAAVVAPAAVRSNGPQAGEDQGHSTEKALDVAKKEFDRSVETKRESLREQHGENLSGKQAEAILQTSDSAVDRAAVLLELNASRAAEKEAEHLLAQFTGIVPDNPRVMKRMVNAFAMRRAIGILEDSRTPIDVLARWTILEQRFPALADLLIEHPEWAKTIAGKVKDRDREKLAPALRTFINVDAIRGIIGKAGDRSLTAEHVRAITRGSAL